MIKNPEKFREYSERQRIRFLRDLTYIKSAEILEQIITPETLKTFTKKSTSHPCSLIMYAKRKSNK